MAETEIKLCSNPGCEQPGTSACSACKTSFYCGPICQTADWPHHKEECDGHLRKLGKVNLDKAKVFADRERNWMQSLLYAEIAATKLKKLKDRRLETVLALSDALECKYNAYGLMGRYKEAKESAEERYTLWAMNQMRHPGSIFAAFGLIQSCLHNGEFEDAEHYARHAMFMINDMNDNFIPSDQRSRFLADGSQYLALAIHRLAESGGIPPERKKKEGGDAIEYSRQALKLHTQLHGIESAEVGKDMGVLADILDYFNDVDDDEIPRLLEQGIVILGRVEGNVSYNMAVSKKKLGVAYAKRANRAMVANDLDRAMANFELALPAFRDAARIYTAINRLDRADDALYDATHVEMSMRQIEVVRATKAPTATRG